MFHWYRILTERRTSASGSTGVEIGYSSRVSGCPRARRGADGLQLEGRNFSWTELVRAVRRPGPCTQSGFRIDGWQSGRQAIHSARSDDGVPLALQDASHLRAFRERQAVVGVASVRRVFQVSSTDGRRSPGQGLEVAGAVSPLSAWSGRIF